MKLKKIDLFAPIPDQYGVVEYFTHELYQALVRQGIECRILEADYENPQLFIDQIVNDPPDCTLSFNGVLPDEQGRFLADLINIPHVAYLTYSPKEFFPLLKSPNNIIVSIDQDFCQTLKSPAFPNVLFIPAGVSKDTPKPQDPLYDVLMLNSFIDYEGIRESWHANYSPALCEVLEEAAEWVMTDKVIPYIQAFVQTMDKHMKKGAAIDPRQINYPELLDGLESYISGKSRVDLLKGISKEFKIDVVGSFWESKPARKLFADYPHIHFHKPVPFIKASEFMRRAKIVLNISPEIKRGLNERILTSMSCCGAVVVSLDTPYLSEIFVEGEEILLFGPRQWDEMNHKIRTYLKDEKKRFNMVQKASTKVLRDHSWDKRAEALIRELPKFLEKIKTEKS